MNIISNNPWLKINTDETELILAECDRKSIKSMIQTCRFFKDITYNSQKEPLRLFWLAEATLAIDFQLRKNSEKPSFILSDSAPEHPATKKITKQEFEQSPCYDLFQESVIDALCDLDVDQLEAIKINNFHPNLKFEEILDKAKKRDKGHVYIHANQVLILQFPLIYSDGKTHGSYGLNKGWHCSTLTHVTSKRTKLWGDAKKIDSLLPIALFLGKREGDSFSFLLGEREIKLTCNQKLSNSEANFEEILKKCLASPAFVIDENMPTREEQEKMYADMETSYLASLGENYEKQQ